MVLYRFTTTHLWPGRH